MNLNLTNTINLMKKYLDIPSPAGYTENAVLEIKKDFENLGLDTILTKKGTLIATLPGEDDSNQITISAHMDTLGAIVKEISSDGTLKYHKVGGGCWAAIEGENCTVITRKGKKIRGSVVFKYASTHIYGQTKAATERNEETMIIRLDEKVFTKQDVLDLGISVGDFVCLDHRFEATESGFIKSRYIDNKSAVAMVLEICRYFKENNLTPKHTTNFYISNYEEIGHGVSKCLPEKTKEFVAIDIAPTGPSQTSSEHGVTIVAKDNLSLYDFNLRNKLVDVAEDNNLDYAVDVFTFYGSDASEAIRGGEDVQIACVGPGTNNSHHYERTHIEAIENTLKLLINYMLKE